MTKNEAKRAFLDKGVITKEVFNKFLHEDPTPQKKYVFWMIKEYLKQASEEELVTTNIDVDDLFMGILGPIFSYTTEYSTLLNRLPQENRDVYKLSFTELAEIVDTINNGNDELGEKKSLRKKAYENSSVIYDENGVSVVVPGDHDGICYFGQGTKWCVSMKGDSGHFTGYYFHRKNTFYIINVTGKGVQAKIKEYYQDKWEKMGIGRDDYQGFNKFVLTKNGRDITEVFCKRKDKETAFMEKLNLTPRDLGDYTIEEYSYRNFYKVALLIPPLKGSDGKFVYVDGDPQPDFKNVEIYTSDDIPFNSGWKQYLNIVGLGEHIGD